MKKNFIYLIMFTIIYFLTFQSVFATTQIDLYATCNYKDSNGGTRTVKITKKGLEFEGVGSGYSGPNWRCKAGTTTAIKLKKEDFIKDDKYDCSLVQNLYEKSISTTVDKQKGKCEVTLQKDEFDKAVSSSKTFKYDASSSKVYVSSVSGATEEKKEEVKEEYDKVCSTDVAKIYINMTDYSKSKIDYNYDLDQCTTFTDNNILKRILENYYTCPIQMEIRKASHQGVTNCGLWFSFEADGIKEDSIVVDELYSGPYTCGIVINFIQQLNKVDKNFDGDPLMKKQYREKLVNYCRQVYNSIDVDSPTKCVLDCMEVIEQTSDLLGFDKGGQCGFSERLLNFIANIIKWVKYIIPVIVIVLGILDFIKAISSDKDDEIKKVQGKFVKRLIAAALIFIIPFILEFVLNKMGFDANGCGIIDL